MGTGYFLVRGDKTTCGGSIIEGCDNHFIHGQATARNGDKYICRADKKIYHIAGGIPNYFIHGVAAAGTAHSRGTCPCKCRFINSFTDCIYGFESEAVKSTVKASRSTSPLHSQPLPESSTIPKPVAPVVEPAETPTEPKEERLPVDAGFCVLPYGTTPKTFEPYLFNTPPQGTKELYNELNPDMKKKPGSIVIIADPERQDHEQLKHLENARDRIDSALEPLTLEEARFLYQNRNIIDIITSYSSDYGGVLSDMSEKYFKEIENTLIKIQDAYKNQYITRGTLIGEQFFIERRRLFKELDSILLKMFRDNIGLAQYDDMRKALRLSSSSIVHRWNQTGVNDIEGYATYIEKSAKLAKLMKNYNRISIGLSALNGANSIYDACTVGQECMKTTYTEVGKFAGGLAGGASIGLVLEPITAGACSLVLTALSAPAGGIGGIACGIIVPVALSFGAGKIGEKAGESVGELIYNQVY